MPSSLFSSPTPPVSNGNMMQKLSQFAQLVRGRGDPQKMVQMYMQQNNITQEQMQQTMQQAQEIARMMGLR